MKKKILFLVAAFIAVFSGCHTEQNELPRFGAILSLTGAAAPYGQDNLKGLQLAQENLRTEGYAVDLRIQDSAGDPAQAVSLARHFAGDTSILAILGPTRTGEAVAVAKLLPELNIASMSVGSTGDWKNAAGEDFNKWMFRSTRVDTYLVRPLLTMARDRFGVKRVAAIYTANDDWAVSVMRLYETVLTQLGIQLVAKESQMSGDTDRSPQLIKIKAANPDAFIVNTLSSDAPTIADQARRLGIRARFLGTAGFSSPNTWSLAKPGTLDGTLVAENYYSTSPRPIVKAFTEQYKAKFGAEAPPYAAYAYDGLRILARAVRNAGSRDRGAIRDAIGSLTHFDGVLGDLTYHYKGDAEKLPVILEIHGGKYALVQ